MTVLVQNVFTWQFLDATLGVAFILLAVVGGSLGLAWLIGKFDTYPKI